MKYWIRFFTTTLFLLIVTVNICSQYKFNWAQTYGGDAVDEAFGLVETATGDLILCGFTKAQEKHMWIIKLDENGNSRWGRTYKAKPVSEGKDILIGKDSNIVAAGYSIKPFSYQSDLWLVKLNQQGEKLWDKNFGGSADESASGIAEAHDGGYILAGVTNTTSNFQDDAWILKVDSAGEKIWDVVLGGSKPDKANDVIVTQDNSIIICGETSSRGEGYKSFWVSKMDSTGRGIWDNIYRINMWDMATALTEGIDGYIYVTGYTKTFSAIDYDIVLLKLDKDGNLIWQKVFSWGRWDQATSICTSFDNGIVVAGFSRSGNELSSDFAVTKFNGDGTVIWENIFVRKSLDYSNKIIETRDNGLAIAGTTYMQGRGWDYALLKFMNNDLPTIQFSNDSITTSTNEIFSFKACISSKSNLKRLQLFFNDSLLITHDGERNNVTEGCNYSFANDLKLNQGQNIVEIVITDFKNHQIRNSCQIFFIPPSKENW